MQELRVNWTPVQYKSRVIATFAGLPALPDETAEHYGARATAWFEEKLWAEGSKAASRPRRYLRLPWPTS